MMPEEESWNCTDPNCDGTTTTPRGEQGVGLGALSSPKCPKCGKPMTTVRKDPNVQNPHRMG